MGRAPCCDKDNVKRGSWSPEEDATLRSYVERHGTGGNWIALPQKAGLRRCGKSCRLRWLNYLRPDIKHGCFTEEEDNIIYTLFNNIGSRWSVIASHLPGRTDNDVKNYWNTKLKKRLMACQQPANPSPSPTTHSPSPPAAAPPLPPLVPSVKAEDFSGAPFDWGFAFGQDAYRFISDLPPLPIPAAGLTACRPAEIANTTPDNSSAASSSIDNWSAATASSSRGGDYFLSELGFDSYTEFLGGYGEVAPLIYQRVTNYS